MAAWLLAAFAAVAVTAAAPAAAFTPGDVVVLRVGDGAAALTSNGAAAFLNEYNSAGAPQGTPIALPTTVNGSNNPLVLSGTSTVEGMLTRSADGRYLALAGYDAAVGTPSVSGSSATAIPRTIARVDSSGAVDTTTALTDLATGSSPRSAFTTDGQAFWATGGAGGVRAFSLGATTSTQLNTDITNLRVVDGFFGQLYASTDAGTTTTRLGAVGSGFPTTGGQAITDLTGVPSTIGPNEFQLFDLSGAVPEPDTLYVADENPGGGVQKYSLVTGTWTANGTISGTSIRGIAGIVTSSGAVTLYATNSTDLYTVTDTSGYNMTPPTSLNSIATAPSNTAFRGVVIAPSVPAAPTFTSTTPSSPANNNNPSILGNAPGGISVSLYTNNTCTGIPVARSDPTTFAAGLPVNVPDDSTTTFHATTTDGEGVTSACSTSSISYTEDSTAPTGVHITTTLPPFSLSSPFTVAWGGATDAGSGVMNYNASYTTAPYNSGFGAPSLLKTTAGPGNASFAAAPGNTYCFYVTATDNASNTSGASPSKCTATPIDDAALTGSGWTRFAGQTGYYRRTFSSTSTKGRTLTKTGVMARRIALVATKCPGCGTVAVLQGGKLLKQVSLSASTRKNQQIIPIAAFTSVHTGTVTIRVVSSRQTVVIDGLGVSL
jgi:hypothetical protein